MLAVNNYFSITYKIFDEPNPEFNDTCKIGEFPMLNFIVNFNLNSTKEILIRNVLQKSIKQIPISMKRLLIVLLLVFH